MLLVSIALLAAANPEPTSFEKDLRPVLRKHCVSCHNADRPRGGLDLSTFNGLMQGGNSGKVALAGNPEASPLYTHTAHLEDPVMPPGKPKIPDKEIVIIERWIKDGLVERPGAQADIVVSPAGGLRPATPADRPSAITALATHPRTSMVAVSGYKQALVFQSGKLLGAVDFSEGEVHVLRFSRDGSLLLVGGGVGGLSGKVVGFESKTWKRQFEIGDEADTVLAADISPDNKRIALGGPGRVVKLFEVSTGKQLVALKKPTDWVTAIRFSPDGLLLAAGDRFGGLWVWEAGTGKDFATLRGHAKGITGLDCGADGEMLASSSGDGTVRLWDMHKGEESTQWVAHEGGVQALSWQANGKFASGGRDGRVKLWSQPGVLDAGFGPLSDEAMQVCWTSDGQVLSGDWAGEVRQWPSGKRWELPTKQATAVAVVLPPEPRLSALQPSSEVELAREEMKRANEELEEARKALAAAEAAAASIRKLVEARLAASQKAAEKLRQLEKGP